MSTVTATMFVPCPQCGVVRTLRVKCTPSAIGYALGCRCGTCTHTLRGGQERATDLAAEIRWMCTTPEVAAKRLGTTVGAIARRLQRAGMYEQARPFSRIERRNRRRLAA